VKEAVTLRPKGEWVDRQRVIAGDEVSTFPPAHRRSPSKSYFTKAKHGKPVELSLSKPTVRKADMHSGQRSSEKAKAGL